MKALAKGLAAALLAGAWQREPLVERAGRALGHRPRWLRPWIDRLLSIWPSSPPRSARLASWIQSDAGFQLAVDEGDELEIVWVPSPAMVPVAGAPTAWPLPPITTAGALAAWLGVTSAQLDWYADSQGRERRCSDGPLRHYRYRWVSKRHGEVRLIESPKPRLKSLQRRVLRGILDLVLLALLAAEPNPTRDDVIEAMKPYSGESTTVGIDGSTLKGKVMCGYQGWFAAEGDGSGRGWRHYPYRGQFQPGSCSIDLWPDVTELEADEKYPTPFRHADGRVARVFSSTNRPTVLRHFRWMKDFGIDGAFVQRFGVETVDPKDLRHCNSVLAHCRDGANLHGRCYAVMYDLAQ